MTYCCFSAVFSAESVAAVAFIVRLQDRHQHIDRIYRAVNFGKNLRYACSIFSSPYFFPDFDAVG